MPTLKNLRNELWTGSFSDENQAQLQEIIDLYTQSDSPFCDLVCKVIEYARQDIEEKNFKHASVELNVINELPASKEECAEWDKDWFYKNELAVYFEKSKRVERLEVFVELLAKAQRLMVS